MALSIPQRFEGITPEQFGRLAERARGAGIAVEGHSGSAAKFGVEVAWSYLPEEQELTLQCHKTPFYMSTANVNSRLQALVKETLGRAA